MIFYEIKKEKKIFLIILCEIFAFAFLGIILQRFSEIVVTIVDIINTSSILKFLLSIKTGITSVTYKEITFGILNIFIPFVLIRNIICISRSIREEKRLGTMGYFISQSVSVNKIVFTKLLVHTFIFLVEVIFFGILIFVFSLHNVEHPLLREIVNEQLARSICVMLVSGIFMISVGYLHGCISERKHMKSFITYILLIGYGIAILPNILSFIVSFFDNRNINEKILEKVLAFLNNIRIWDIFYLVNPFISSKGYSFWQLHIWLVLGIGMIIFGTFVINREV